MWFSKGKNPADLAPHEMGPPVNFKAAGEDGQKSQGNLILARNAPAFPFVRELFADALSKRCEMVLLDYSRDAVAIRYQIDGIWNDLGRRDRQSGDAMLVVMKKLADLDVNERRQRQEGTFKVEFGAQRVDCTLVSQGVQTGERVQLKMSGKGKNLDTLEQLGMREQMIGQLQQIMNNPEGGLLLLSARPGDGLTTTWSAVLRGADRFLRDYVTIENQHKRTPEVENIEAVLFDPSSGQTPDSVLPSVLLKQPEAIVVPELVNAKTIELLVDQVIKNNTFVMTSINAKEGVEALLRVLALKPSAEKFAEATKAVLFQRLVRRLCETCKQAYQPAPQLLQKLGIPADRPINLYRQYQPPPPEQLVDAKGRPIEAPICADCGGVGFRGRAALFELMEVSDPLREALAKQPKIDVLRQLARSSKHRTIQEEGVAAVVRGTTALNELQRVLKQ